MVKPVRSESKSLHLGGGSAVNFAPAEDHLTLPRRSDRASHKQPPDNRHFGKIALQPRRGIINPDSVVKR
jgi:hypothetical protein